MQFPTSHGLFEAPEFSDHCLCFIKFKSNPPSYGTRPFKFFNLLLKHSFLLDLVAEAWQSSGSGAVSLRYFGFKLKHLKRPMKTLLKENFSDIEKRVAEAYDDLCYKQLLALNDLTSPNIQAELNARNTWPSLHLAEHSFFLQRSKIKCMCYGDQNTPFYHRVTLVRNSGNAIKFLLYLDGSRTNSLEEVHQLAINHFQTILCRVKGAFCPDLPEFLESLIVLKCSDLQKAQFILPCSNELIQNTVFKMPHNRNPGPDGFPVEFFKGAWSILGPEFTASVQKVF